MKRHLQDVLDEIVYASSNDFNERQLQDEIEKRMPDYDIVTWDADEYNTSLTSSVMSYVLDEVERQRKNDREPDIMYGEWSTDNCDAYFMVVASRKDMR